MGEIRDLVAWNQSPRNAAQLQPAQALSCLWSANIIPGFLLLEKATSYPQRSGGNMLQSLNNFKIEGFSEAGNM